MANPLSFDNPRLDNVRALVTTKWDRGYSTRAISNIETFFVDSSIDNDSDTWQVEIGDPNGSFLQMLERNSEVRVELISSTPGSAGHIFTGISDDITYSEAGVMAVVGRDYASLALDSTCVPQQYKHVRAQYIINKQARQLGFTNVSLALFSDQVKKTIKTDGSESYWEFWYRLVRNEKMWLWVGPNGALIGNRLNYTQSPSYWFGTPQATDSKAIKAQYLPVERIEIRKSTQGRVGEVWVLYKDGKTTRKISASDPTLGGWMKRPVKLIDDKFSHTEKGAKKTAWNEIFEGKVGSLEIRLTISQPNYIIRTNRIAVVRIPQIGFAGQFYIVGWRMQAGPDGYVQEIRLREKYIALSRRVPHEPTIDVPITAPKTHLPGHDVPTPDNEAVMQGMITKGQHPEWADFFYNAAKKNCDGWNFDIFLAAILSVAWIESTIKNVRQKFGHNGDGTEWYEYEKTAPPPPEKKGPRLPGSSEARDYYEYLFVNDQPAASAKGITTARIGVGPMQLTDDSLKHEADDWWSTNREHAGANHDQYSGGRWRPEANIMIGAERLAGGLKSTGLGPGDGDQIGAMCQAYGFYRWGGASSAEKRLPDEKKLRHAMMVDPGYLQAVKTALPIIRGNTASAQDDISEGSDGSVIIPGGWPTIQATIAAFQDAVWQGPPTEPGSKPLLPSITYIPAAHQQTGRNGNKIKWIVIHTMEGDEGANTAENCANYFGTGNTHGPASAHYCVDRSHIFQICPGRRHGVRRNREALPAATV